MRISVWLFALLLFSVSAFAQRKIIVQGSYPSLYVQHKVAAKESLYSIGRLYNHTAKSIAQQNGVNENGILATGKEIKIPVDRNNFTQDGQRGESEILIPLYYQVQKSDNLFRIAQTFGRVRLDFVREWNDLNTDVLSLNQKLIIGHLKIGSEYANDVVQGISNKRGNDETGYEVNEEKKTEPKKEPEKKPEPIKPEVKPSPANSDTDEGFFVTQFPSKGNSSDRINVSGDAATFKTTSGWTDRKYYVLMNSVTPGTIVRITATNNRSICAKVLGALPEMKENTNLLIRISNAAASALGISEPKFSVSVGYFK